MTDFSAIDPARGIAIIGGGCAGTLVAVQVLRQAAAPVRVRLIERRPPPGPGVAYATDRNEHRLNVAAGRMSALPGQPSHFYEWARARAGHLGFPDAIAADDYLPRWMYGQYLEQLLAEARASARPGVVAEVVLGEAVDIEVSPGGPQVILADGRRLDAAAVVLALGVLPGEYPIRRPLPFYRSARYLHSPLLRTSLSNVARSDDLLIVGAGLTAVDLIVQCSALGCRGTLHALSRRGLRHQAHRPGLPPYPLFLDKARLPRTARAALQAVRREVGRAAGAGADWRAVIDSLRPVAQDLWREFSWEERARFLRHLRPYWEAHRHRLPPQTAAIVARMEAEGRLRFHAGRLVSLREQGDGAAALIKLRGREEFLALRVAKVINCTGPRTDYSKYQHPLLVNLLAAGLIGHDPLALGLDALPGGEVLRYGGASPAGWLFTLGAPLKGALWETTAVPEIRCQAEALAGRLLRLAARGREMEK